MKALTPIQKRALISLRGKTEISAAQLGFDIFGTGKKHLAASSVLNALYARGLVRVGTEIGYEQHRYVYELNDTGKRMADQILMEENAHGLRKK